MMTPCFLGAGITTPLGTGLASQSAAIRLAPIPAQPVTCNIGKLQQTVPYRLLADFPLQDIGHRLDTVIDEVITQALQQAALPAGDIRDIALFIGSSSYDISVSEHSYIQAKRAEVDAIPLEYSPSFGNLAHVVRKRYGLRGPDFSFNTACTSSANALWYATRLIRSGRIRHALVLGVELFNYITALGFHGLGLLTPSVMKPFDVDRNGLALGEAAAALVIGPGNPGDFSLLGGANLCDTYSMSAANADGSSVAAVIYAALADARLSPASIASIKIHGTASLLNDEAEAAGLLQVFANRKLPPVYALKPHLGHTLGACGLAELIISWQALANGVVPANPGIGGDSGVLGVALNQQPVSANQGAHLLNYFGFGGNNTALVIGQAGGDR